MFIPFLTVQTLSEFYVVLNFINYIKDTDNCKVLTKHKEAWNYAPTPQVPLTCMHAALTLM